MTPPFPEGVKQGFRTWVEPRAKVRALKDQAVLSLYWKLPFHIYGRVVDRSGRTVASTSFERTVREGSFERTLARLPAGSYAAWIVYKLTDGSDVNTESLPFEINPAAR